MHGRHGRRTSFRTNTRRDGSTYRYPVRGKSVGKPVPYAKWQKAADVRNARRIARLRQEAARVEIVELPSGRVLVKVPPEAQKARRALIFMTRTAYPSLYPPGKAAGKGYGTGLPAELPPIEEKYLADPKYKPLAEKLMKAHYDWVKAGNLPEGKKYFGHYTLGPDLLWLAKQGVTPKEAWESGVVDAVFADRYEPTGEGPISHQEFREGKLKEAIGALGVVGEIVSLAHKEKAADKVIAAMPQPAKPAKAPEKAPPIVNENMLTPTSVTPLKPANLKVAKELMKAHYDWVKAGNLAEGQPYFGPATLKHDLAWLQKETGWGDQDILNSGVLDAVYADRFEAAGKKQSLYEFKKYHVLPALGLSKHSKMTFTGFTPSAPADGGKEFKRITPSVMEGLFGMQSDWGEWGGGIDFSPGWEEPEQVIAARGIHGMVHPAGGDYEVDFHTHAAMMKEHTRQTCSIPSAEDIAYYLHHYPNHQVSVLVHPHGLTVFEKGSDPVTKEQLDVFGDYGKKGAEKKKWDDVRLGLIRGMEGSGIKFRFIPKAEAMKGVNVAVKPV